MLRWSAASSLSLSLSLSLSISNSVFVVVVVGVFFWGGTVWIVVNVLRTGCQIGFRA